MSGYLYFDGTAGSYASSPHSASLATITDDFVFEVDIALDSYATANLYFIDKVGGAGQRAYRMYMSAGALILQWTADGTTVLTIASTALGLTNGTRYTLKGVFDVDNDAVGKTLTTYIDGVLHNTTLQAATTSIAVAAGRELGIMGRTDGTSQPPGKIYQVRLWSDLAQTAPAFNADFTDLTAAELTAGSFTEDTNGAVVTINGAAWTYTVVVPDLVGLTVAQAQTLIGSQLVIVGGTSGVITAQDLVAGSLVSAGDTITITAGSASRMGFTGAIRKPPRRSR